MPHYDKNILMLVPPCYRPDLPNFSGKYNLLSKRYSGHILCRTSSEFEGRCFGRFELHPLLMPNTYGVIDKIRNVLELIFTGIRLHRERPFDLIISHDPLTLGIAGTLIKMMTKAKLIVEVNGHLLEAGFLGRFGKAAKLRKLVFEAIIRGVLNYADGIKCINSKLVEEVKNVSKNTRTFCFHDYVPISQFLESSEDCKFVFFAGHPFHIKGVDLLISAFSKLSNDFPDYRLVIMGHNNVDLDKYKEMAVFCDRIEFLKPVFNDEIIKYFRQCSFFVLPSRSEAMGRVLLEAMASGKAVVASRVGGIPEVVDDKVTGFLFDSEDPHDLEQKMRLLLADPSLRSSMGKAGRKRVETFFSEKEYVSRFISKVEEVLTNQTDKNRNIN